MMGKSRGTDIFQLLLFSRLLLALLQLHNIDRYSTGYGPVKLLVYHYLAVGLEILLNLHPIR